MNTEKPRKLISPEEWSSRLDKVKIPRHQMNQLVLNYLLHEGFKDAAEAFQAEANLTSSIDSSLNIRNEIRTAILTDQIDSAISLINTLDASILSTQPNLLFTLRLQKLLSYIQNNNLPDALAYGQEVLAPTAKDNPQLLKELEKFLSLLAFNDISTSPLSELSSPLYKLKIASEVNSAILKTQSSCSTNSLTQILKMLALSQRALSKHINFPLHSFN